jgi:two-component system cell cycle response regulator
MTQPARGLQVLVVDDSPISRKLLEYALAEDAYSVRFAKDGREAMDLFAKRPADVVITDWEMSDFSGLELCRKIRAEFPAAYTYLFLLTSNSDKKSLAAGLAAGADDYITKPFDADELRARVGVGRRVIEMQRTLEANNQRLEEQARTEPLTGLPNRRAIEEWATKRIAGAGRHGYQVSVILADLDSHKEIGDSFGHAASDAALKAFAEILKQNTRVSDMCGHWGGHQFVLLVSHVEKEGVLLFVDLLKTRIAVQNLDCNGVPSGLSVTFGVACSEHDKKPELASLLKKADAALIEAKRVLQGSLV